MKWTHYPKKGKTEKRLMPKKKTGKVKKQKTKPAWWEDDILQPWAEMGKRENDEDEWLEHAIEALPDVNTVPREKDRVNNIVSWHSKILDVENTKKDVSSE